MARLNWKAFDEFYNQEGLDYFKRPNAYGNLVAYLAVSDDGKVYKIGSSRHLEDRAKNLRNNISFKAYNFRITHFVKGQLEDSIQSGLQYAGAITAPPCYWKTTKEIFYLHPLSVKRLIKACGFRPISEYKPVGTDVNNERLVTVEAKRKV